ncbi:MAG: cysteine peptidase family C39 domain-containing protein [Verrucomicrobiota bacterium]
MVPLFALINPLSHVNPLGVLAVVASLIAFVVFYRRLRGRPEKVRILWLAVLVPLSLPAISFAVYYSHKLPEWEWFYALRSYPGTEFLAVFLGGAAGVVATLVGPFLRVVLLPLLIVVTAVPYIKPLIGPIPEDMFQDRQWKGAALQSTPSTCGPTSVVNLLNRLDVAASEREIARAAFSYQGGTEAWYLARYVRQRGLNPRFVFEKTFTSETGLPAMVGVRFPGGAGHFIAVIELKDNQVIYVDPLNGETTCSLAEFLARYDFTGFHMVVRRG